MFSLHYCSPLSLSPPPPQLRQYGIKLVVLWLQALQDAAGDACIELLASAIPHFPPKKTPLGLPVEATPLTTPTSSQTLCERYGRYSCNETPTDRHGNRLIIHTPLLLTLYRLGIHEGYSAAMSSTEYIIRSSTDTNGILINHTDYSSNIMEDILVISLLLSPSPPPPSPPSSPLSPPLGW